MSLQGGAGVALGFVGAKYAAQQYKASPTVVLVASLAGAIAVPAVMGDGINPLFAASAYAGAYVGKMVYSKLSGKSSDVVAPGDSY